MSPTVIQGFILYNSDEILVIHNYLDSQFSEQKIRTMEKNILHLTSNTFRRRFKEASCGKYKLFIFRNNF